MGMRKLFSFSSYDNTKKTITSYFSRKNSVNPDSYNYLILRNIRIGNFLIIEIKYLNCTNYEGKKILIFEKCTIDQLKKQKSIDPHFSENKKFLSPIARFEPTDRGWKLALDFCRFQI